MNIKPKDIIHFAEEVELEGATLVLAFSGWMDGGDVSTGTVERLVDLVQAEPLAEIDSEPFYLYNFPGSMELTALFRPHVEIKEGLIQKVEMPSNQFYVLKSSNLAFFIGKEPNYNWRTFAKCIFYFASLIGIKRIFFVGSVGGTVPHTREPRLYVTASEEHLVEEMLRYGARRSEYEGPGSFTSYLMTQTPEKGLEMISLVAEIPAYLQGTNPMSIEAVTRRLASILKLPVDLDALRTASTEWEIGVSNAIEDDEELASRVRQLEEDYDQELLDES